MEDSLALGMVAGGLFIAILMLYNRAMSKDIKENEAGAKVLRYGLIAGLICYCGKVSVRCKV
jgi:uncharacterized membrane protein YbhN (UPF0104 family)